MKQKKSEKEKTDQALICLLEENHPTFEIKTVKTRRVPRIIYVIPQQLLKRYLQIIRLLEENHPTFEIKTVKTRRAPRITYVIPQQLLKRYLQDNFSRTNEQK